MAHTVSFKFHKDFQGVTFKVQISKFHTKTILKLWLILLLDCKEDSENFKLCGKLNIVKTCYQNYCVFEQLLTMQ